VLQVPRNIADVTAATTETGAKATMVLESSDRLGRKLQALQVEVSSFLAGVRAA
jgi:methyl-accepting chemotaxis protein